MTCPACGDASIAVTQYDHGIDRATGYHDEGEHGRCAACGYVADVEEFIEASPQPEVEHA